MADQTSLTDYAVEQRTCVPDGGEQRHFDPEAGTVSDAWEGAYLYTSWGYGQTNVELAQVVEVSDSGKTVKARRVGAERVDAAKGSESLRPTADQFDDEFRLYVRGSGGDPLFRGTYPMNSDGDLEGPTRRGSFFPWSNKAGQTVHQTAPNHGH